jgi:hypothetical protein
MAVDSGKIEKIVLGWKWGVDEIFLTNKKKSIPIVIVVDKATGGVLGKWGPRPKGATDLITDYKKWVWHHWWNC